MEQNYIEIAKHCIGLDRKKPYTRHGKQFYRPYRNYFTTGSNHDDWDVMVDAGYAKRGKSRNQHGGLNIRTGSRGCSMGIDIYVECDCGAKVQICEEFGETELINRWNRRASDLGE